MPIHKTLHSALLKWPNRQIDKKDVLDSQKTMVWSSCVVTFFAIWLITQW